jgi:histidinol phosphatase-like PHP family hydrolase
MKLVPESCVRELGQAARETDTAIEINGCANLRNPVFGTDYVKEYVDFLAILAEEGATFSLGSDAHDIGRLEDIRATWDVAEQLGLSSERIWQPGCAPVS